jgi:hypothetical protein
MADITMCVNTLCPNASSCYRVTATPSEYWQSYCDFKYQVGAEGVICSNYWPTHKVMDADVIVTDKSAERTTKVII